MSKKGSQKQFCLKGHNTFIIGRTVSHQCKKCQRDENKEYYDKNRLKMLQKAIKWQADNPEKVKATKETPKRKKYLEEYNKQYAPKKKEWRENNRALNKILHSRSKGNRKLRVPIWGQEGILKFYDSCPNAMTVDHIIPLCGRKVSGLDVVWNLQYLTPSLNSRKHNKCNLLEASEWYGKILKGENDTYEK